MKGVRRLTPASLAIGEAALRLHAPDLDVEQIRRLLVQLVVDLQLAEDVHFHAGQVAPEAACDGVLTVAVHRHGGVVDGTLRCLPSGPDAAEGVRLLADHAGLALDRLVRLAQVSQREVAARRVAEHLQDSLLPDLPVVASTSVDVEYRAASREARVGGDFYDVFPLPDGHVLLMVGDVVGKGVEAASRTSLITHTLRTLALQGLPLDTLLARADELVTFQDPEIMATIWCGLYDPESGELAFASLGHPPALLLRADGDPIHLSMQGLPLGLRELSTDPPEIRNRRLEPRDLLVLYTDGVVEASGDYLAGQQALLAAIERRRDDPLAEIRSGALADLLTDAGHRDDAVLFLLRRR